MKLLDAAEERILLLCAPAGYGKTTLARQWAKTVNRVAWVSCTPAHRDVVVFAEDLAAEIERLGGAPLVEFQGYLRAQSSPQRVARDIAIALARRANEANVRWLIVDDYHELAQVSDLGDAFAVLAERIDARVMVASRVRPDWATSRRALYGELFELDTDVLAMDADESVAVVGHGRERLLAQARGWPAVLALAASPRAPEIPGDSLPDALHQYLAEELFAAATPTLRERLIEMALLPDTSASVLRRRWTDSSEVIDQGREIGFLTASEEPELHPLIREFLLAKVAATPDRDERVRGAIAESTAASAWTTAFELILRFDVRDMLERTLEAAYRPLLGSGRLSTLSEVASAMADERFPPPIVDLIDADVAHRSGAFAVSDELAQRAKDRWSRGAPLAGRAAVLQGQNGWALSDLEHAERACREALAIGNHDADIGDALYGLALVTLHSEDTRAAEMTARLRERSRNTLLDFLRYESVALLEQRLTRGFPEPLELDHVLAIRQRVGDIRLQTMFVLIASNAYAFRADFDEALRLCDLAKKEAAEFGLDFAFPHIYAHLGMLQVGIRKFGDAEHSLLRLEEAVERHPNNHHELNARILRAQIALALSRYDDAVRATTTRGIGRDVRATRAEVCALGAIGLATRGDAQRALEAAEAADAISQAIEIRALTTATRSIVAARAGKTEQSREILVLARRYGMWNALLVAMRASPELFEAIAADDRAHRDLALLFRKSRDWALARKAGIQLRPVDDPQAVLTPRELEVLDLLCQGLRNREISAALVIADSTTKVHVRHVLEKLGVRSRAEAAARYRHLLD